MNVAFILIVDVLIAIGILGIIGLVKTLVKNPTDGLFYCIALLPLSIGVSGDEHIALVWGLAGIPAFLAYFFLRIKHNKYNKKNIAVFRNWISSYYFGPVGLAIGLMVDKYNLLNWRNNTI